MKTTNNKPFVYQFGGRGFAPYPFRQQSNLYGQSLLSPTGFMPTYAGQPLEQFNQTADLLKEEYDKNVANYDQLQILKAQQNSLEGDRTAFDTAMGDYNKELENITQQGRYERMGPQIRTLANKFINDPELKAMAQSYDAYEKEKELINEMRARGITPEFTGDPSKHQTISIDPQTGKKVYNVYSTQVEGRLDYAGERRKILSVIKPDQFIKTPEQASKFNKALEGYIRTGKISGIGIDNADFLQKIEAALDEYESSAAYKQEKRVLMQDSNMTEEQADQVVRERLASSAELITYQQEDEGYMADKLWEQKQRLALEAAKNAKIAPPSGRNFTEDPAMSKAITSSLLRRENLAPVFGISDITKFDPTNASAAIGGDGKRIIYGRLNEQDKISYHALYTMSQLKKEDYKAKLTSLAKKNNLSFEEMFNPIHERTSTGQVTLGYEVKPEYENLVENSAIAKELNLTEAGVGERKAYERIVDSAYYLNNLPEPEDKYTPEAYAAANEYIQSEGAKPLNYNINELDVDLALEEGFLTPHDVKDGANYSDVQSKLTNYVSKNWGTPGMEFYSIDEDRVVDKDDLKDYVTEPTTQIEVIGTISPESNYTSITGNKNFSRGLKVRIFDTKTGLPKEGVVTLKSRAGVETPQAKRAKAINEIANTISHNGMKETFTFNGTTKTIQRHPDNIFQVIDAAGPAELAEAARRLNIPIINGKRSIPETGVPIDNSGNMFLFPDGSLMVKGTPLLYEKIFE